MLFPALRGGCCTVLFALFDVNSNKRRLLLLVYCANVSVQPLFATHYYHAFLRHRHPSKVPFLWWDLNSLLIRGSWGASESLSQTASYLDRFSHFCRLMNITTDTQTALQTNHPTSCHA